jgi:hypothetical protein
VRDGDPAALAGLCDRRGPAVLAYCRHVAGDAASAAAAAASFGHFRAAVFAAQDPASINPEALLVNATRHTAAQHAGMAAPIGVCAVVPLLLAARADRSITLADLDRLEEHLETCWTCRAPVARFEAAERAYRNPPAEALAPETAELIIAALTAAAPLRSDEPPPEPEPEPEPEPTPEPLTAAALNGTGHLAPETDMTAAAVPVEGLDMPTTEFRTIDDLDLDPGIIEPSPEVDRAPRPARRGRSGAAAGMLGGLRASAARTPAAGRAARAPRATGETHLPRPQRRHASDRPAHRERGAARPAGNPRSVLRPSVVLPILLIAFALVIALFVAGVFGADDPTPSSSSVTPPVAAPPAATTTPEIVVVPGADASGHAVEVAKARARAKRRPPRRHRPRRPIRSPRARPRRAARRPRRRPRPRPSLPAVEPAAPLASTPTTARPAPSSSRPRRTPRRSPSSPRRTRQ